MIRAKTKASKLEVALTVYQALKDMRESGAFLNAEIYRRCEILFDKVLAILEESI